MSLVIDLPPDVETRLEAEASRQGVSPASIVGRLVTENLPSLTGGRNSLPPISPALLIAKADGPNALPYEDWKARFDAIVNRPVDPDAPVLTAEMMRRAHIYEESDEDDE